MRRTSALLCLSFILACQKPVAPPTIAVKAPATAPVGIWLALDGSATVDPNAPPLPLSFRWTITAHPPESTASLELPETARANFKPDTTGSYTFRLTVSNGLRSSSSDVTVTADICGANPPDVTQLDASLETPLVGSPVQLGAVVTDADNSSACAAFNVPAQRLTYAWSLRAQPIGSQAALTNASASNPSFSPDVPGDYVVRLVVTDSTGRVSTPIDRTFTAASCSPQVAVPTVQPANPAIGDQVHVSVSPTTTCPTGDPASTTWSYAWTVTATPSGAHALLSNESLATATLVGDVAGTYSLHLLLSDGAGRTTSADVDVSLSGFACGFAPPVVSGLQTSIAPAAHRPVTITASVTDADNSCGPFQALAYQWSLESTPAGSAATLVSADGPVVSFTPDLPGSYRVSVVVTDSTGRAASSSVTFTAASCSPPVARIGVQSPIVVSAGTSVGPFTLFQSTTLWLDGSASTPSNCLPQGTALTYSWSAVSLPAGSPGDGGLNSGTAVNPSAGSLNAVGEYTYQLVVSDAAGTSAPATLKVDIQGTVPGEHVGSGNLSIVQALDPTTNKPAYAWFDQTTSSVKISFCTSACETNAAVFNTETVASGLGSLSAGQIATRGVGLAFTSTGVAEVAYFIPNQCTFAFAWRSGAGSWTSKTMVSSPGGSCGSDGVGNGGNNGNGSVGRDLSLALRSDDLPGIAFLSYSQSNGRESLQFLECTDSATKCQTSNPAFSTPVTVDNTGPQAGFEPSLRYTSTNHPRVASYDLDQTDLHYSFCDSGCTSNAWGASNTVRADAGAFGGDVGRMPSLVLDASDNPRISFTDRSNGSAAFASCDSGCSSQGNWNQDVIDQNRGDYTSLALDAQGNAYVVYTDVGGGSLYYAVLRSGNWSRFTVDSSRTYFYTSLTIGAGPVFHIAYGDSTTNSRRNYYTAFGWGR